MGVILLILLLAIAIGYWIGENQPNILLAPVAAGALLLLLILLNRSYEKILMTMAFGSLILGWRGISLTSSVTVYPAEVFIWIGFFLFFSKLIVFDKAKIGFKPSYEYVMLLVLGLAGILVAVNNNHSLGSSISEAKTFLLFIPIAVLLRSVVKSKEDVYYYVKVLLVSGIFVAALGIFERFVPFAAETLSFIFPAPIQIRYNFGTSGAVELANFSFWGGSIVSVIFVPFVGLWLVPLQMTKGPKKALWILAGMAIFAGILVSGYRSAWLGAASALVGFLFVGRKQNALFLILIILIAFSILPTGYVDRVETIYLLDQSGDTALIRRGNALTDGFQSILDKPILGTGWNSRVVFNDWIYIAVALGIPALLIFLAWRG